MPDKSTVLVTGGAGYIGSHTVLQLVARGERVVVLDDLSTGFRQAVRDVPLVVGNVGDRRAGRLAARRTPGRHHHPLRRAHHRARVGREPAQVLRQQHLRHALAARGRLAGRREATSCSPRPPPCTAFRPPGSRRKNRRPRRSIAYGTSKLMSEWMLRDLCAATPMRHVVLRYFNVAGSDPQGRIGQSTAQATLLVKVACEAAVGKRPYLSVFGTDYPTPDGTGVRDYIHVEDLATAHLNALDYLRAGGESLIANCRLRPRLQRARGAVERREDRRPQARRARRAAPRRRPAQPGRAAATGCASCSAGSRGSMTSTPSCAPRWSGKSVCNGNPGRQEAR